MKNNKERNFFDGKQQEKEDPKARANRKIQREIEISLHIEKTFGPVITYLIFYLFFCIYVLNFIVTKYSMDLPNYFNQVIVNDFLQKQFQVNFTMNDFYQQNAQNFYNLNNYSFYSSYINLTEVQIMDLVFVWIKNVYLENIGVVQKKLKFMEKHDVLRDNNLDIWENKVHSNEAEDKFR